MKVSSTTIEETRVIRDLADTYSATYKGLQVGIEFAILASRLDSLVARLMEETRPE